MEDRTLLAVLTVLNDADSGPGSLRQAVMDANALLGADVIDFADSLRGRTITLTSGPLVINDHVTIDGPGAGALTVSGGGTTSVFTVRPETLSPESPLVAVTIDGLTVAHGVGTESLGFGTYGGGLYAFQADVTIRDSVFRGNSATSAGGAVLVFPGFYFDESFNLIGLVPGRLSVSGSTFDGNHAAESGGAIAVYAAQSVVLADSEFTGNAGGGGGAVSTTSFIFTAGVTPSTTSVEGSRFSGNTAEFGTGGAIVARGGSITVSESRFEANRGLSRELARGGAIFAGDGSSLSVEDSVFLANEARGIAGGFFNPRASGGAIHSEFGAEFHVADSRFEGNRAVGVSSGRGGALLITGGRTPATIDDSDFLDNEASTEFLELPTLFFAAEALGGAVYYSGSPLSLEGSTFRGNRAVGGGARFGPAGNAFGGALIVFGSSLNLSDSTFRDNLARGGSGGKGGLAFGGAIFLQAFGLPTESRLFDVRFRGNAALGGPATGAGSPGDGGAVGGGAVSIFGGSLALVDAKVVGNRAVGGDGGPPNEARPTPGAGGDASGGGLHSLDAAVAVADAKFTDNEALGGSSAFGGIAGAARGGAIRGEGGRLDVSDTKVIDNRARGGSGDSGGNGEGGGIWASGVVALADVGVHGNRADGGAGQGLGGGLFLAPTATFSRNKKTKITGNRASTAGDQIFGP